MEHKATEMESELTPKEKKSDSPDAFSLYPTQRRQVKHDHHSSFLFLTTSLSSSKPSVI